jgi:glutathione S-transferase
MDETERLKNRISELESLLARQLASVSTIGIVEHENTDGDADVDVEAEHSNNKTSDSSSTNQSRRTRTRRMLLNPARSESTRCVNTIDSVTSTPATTTSSQSQNQSQNQSQGQGRHIRLASSSSSHPIRSPPGPALGPASHTTSSTTTHRYNTTPLSRVSAHTLPRLGESDAHSRDSSETPDTTATTAAAVAVAVAVKDAEEFESLYRATISSEQHQPAFTRVETGNSDTDSASIVPDLFGNRPSSRGTMRSGSLSLAVSTSDPQPPRRHGAVLSSSPAQQHRREETSQNSPKRHSLDNFSGTLHGVRMSPSNSVADDLDVPGPLAPIRPGGRALTAQPYFSAHELDEDPEARRLAAALVGASADSGLASHVHQHATLRSSRASSEDLFGNRSSPGRSATNSNRSSASGSQITSFQLDQTAATANGPALSDIASSRAGADECDAKSDSSCSDARSDINDTANIAALILSASGQSAQNLNRIRPSLSRKNLTIERKMSIDSNASEVTIFMNQLDSGSRAVIWACKLLQIPYNKKKVELFCSGTGFSLASVPDFRNVPITGALPALQQGPFVVCGTSTVLRSVCRMYDDRCSLYPEAIHGRCVIDDILSWLEYTLSSSVEAIIRNEVLASFMAPSYRTPSHWSAVKQYHEGQVKTALALLDSMCSRSKYLAGTDEPSLADIAVACTIAQTQLYSDFAWSSHKDLQAWYRRMEAMPHFSSVNGVVSHTMTDIASSHAHQLIW